MTATPRPIPVLAVHGNGGGAFRFDRVVPHIPASIDFRPITLPGFAAVPAHPALKSVADYGDHLASLCRQHDRPIVLGHGIGGSIALDMVQRHPDVVRGLILLAPVGPSLGSRKLPLVMNLPGVKTLAQRLIAGRLLRPLWRKKFFAPDVPTAFANQFFDEYRQCSVFGQMFEIINEQWWDSLNPTQTKTVLWWGEKESLLGVNLATAFQRVVPSSTLVVEPGWDHFPMVDVPRDFAGRLADLCHSLDPGAR
jgi:pimeloyl-ACP methyl ester carboxylesterase